MTATNRPHTSPQPSESSTVDITRLDHPVSPETFLAHYANRRPLIIRVPDLALLGWRTHLWSNEYLAYKAGTHEVRVLRRSQGNEYTAETSDYVPMLFRDFIREVMSNPRGNPGFYLNLQTDKILEPPLLQLLGDFTIPPYFKDFLLRCIVLWMGNSPDRLVTVLHHDFNDNLYVVAEGEKHFSIFPPDQALNLYPRGQIQKIERTGRIVYAPGETRPHLSAVNLLDPDWERFPRFREALAMRTDFIVKSGEMLFLPAGWFHQVSSAGRHIALSFFAEIPSESGLNHLTRLLEDATLKKQPERTTRLP